MAATGFSASAIGKIQRQKVTQWVAAQGGHAAQAAEEGAGGGTPDPLGALIASITLGRPARLDDDARLDRDLNLDSLARVQLQSELEERLGVSIGDEEFERIATLGQLRVRLGFASTGSGSDVRAADQPHEQRAERSGEPLRYLYPEWSWWPAVDAMRFLFPLHLKTVSLSLN